MWWYIPADSDCNIHCHENPAEHSEGLNIHHKLENSVMSMETQRNLQSLKVAAERVFHNQATE
jgi:hypothetical protein